MNSNFHISDTVLLKKCVFILIKCNNFICTYVSIIYRFKISPEIKNDLRSL